MTFDPVARLHVLIDETIAGVRQRYEEQQRLSQQQAATIDAMQRNIEAMRERVLAAEDAIAAFVESGGWVVNPASADRLVPIEKLLRRAHDLRFAGEGA